MNTIQSKITENYYLDEVTEERLKIRLEFARDRGLDLLLENLETNRDALPFITELNLIYEIINELESKGIVYEFQYEATCQNGSPDIYLKVGERDIYIQIKRFGQSRVDNMNSRAIDALREKLSKIEKNYVYSLEHSNLLTKNEIEEFCNYIKDHEDTIEAGVMFERSFTENDSFIRIEFLYPSSKKQIHLRYGASMGDPRWNSGEVEEQIRNSTYKALKSLDRIEDTNRINLIYAETLSLDQIDFGDVIYGKEQFLIGRGSCKRIERKNNGLIADEEVLEKLSHYIVLNNGGQLVPDYKKVLFTIDEETTEFIMDLFDFDTVFNKDSDID